MLALYAVCVFPANVKHAFDNVQLPQLPSSWLYHGTRLALQPVIVWSALYCGKIISWPFERGLGMYVTIFGKGSQISWRRVHRAGRDSVFCAEQQAPKALGMRAR
jgi:hypothetical protein